MLPRLLVHANLDGPGVGCTRVGNHVDAVDLSCGRDGEGVAAAQDLLAHRARARERVGASGIEARSGRAGDCGSAPASPKGLQGQPLPLGQPGQRVPLGRSGLLGRLLRRRRANLAGRRAQRHLRGRWLRRRRRPLRPGRTPAAPVRSVSSGRALWARSTRGAGCSVGAGRTCGPAEPAAPVGPVAPSAPGEPCGPAGPAGPTGPAGPLAPSVPGEPCGPAGPTGPAGPAGPTAPWFPCAPGDPVGPGAPVGPRRALETSFALHALRATGASTAPGHAALTGSTALRSRDYPQLTGPVVATCVDAACVGNHFARRLGRSSSGAGQDEERCKQRKQRTTDKRDVRAVHQTDRCLVADGAESPDRGT